MTFTEQSIQTAQVAFFLIDHIGTPPAGANFRSFTTRAMEEHLKKHPCYYRQRPNDGPAKPTLVTPLWMRRRFTDLYKKANHNFYEPRLQGDDITDTLLRKRSTAGFPAEVLATYRYERGTFSESELPANEEPLDEEMTDIEAAENLEAQIDDGARQKANEHDGVKSPRRRTAAKSSNLAAKRIPPRVVRNSEEPSGETEDDDNDLRSTGGNKALDNEENDHSYAGDHGRRVTRHGKDTSKVTSKSAVEVAGVRSKAIAKAPYDASRKETETSTSKGRTRLPQASTMTKPSKRKREGDTDATQASSNSDELVITPKKRRVTNNAKTRNGTARRLSNDIPVAARTDLPPSGPRLDRSAPTPSPITPRVKQNDAQPVAQVAKIPAFAQPDPTSSSIGDQHQPVQTLNYASAQKNKDLYAMLDKATDRVIGSIGRISQTLSSLDKSPSNRLEALYIRCWGPDWKTVKAELIEDGAFQVCDVTMSIIAAFLFDNVLNQQASLGDIEAKQKELKGMTGWAILEALDLKNNEHGFAKRVRAIETKHARELLAKSPASVTEILEQEAKKFTKELWGIIKPHFRGLSTLANAYDLSSDLNERDWQEAFDDNITTLIEAALRYRLELLASGYDHAHTWPEADEKFDEAEMEIHGANRARQNLQVLFTVFPGTKEMVEGSNKMETYSATHATVKVRSAAWETYD